jgi:DNA gyrase/topoisomerase IV subunit A
MDQILPKLYKEYGSYSNYRNFPLDLDGLKPVERRVLLSAYKIARQKFVKSRQVDAYTIGHYHPHGECYGTIVQLVRQGFLIGQGNFGTNVGIESVGPAAPRYTECRASDYTLNLAFKLVDHVPWIETELGDKEPFFLPTLFPICLIGRDYTQGIGFGYKTYIPCYEAKDLYKRLLWLLGKRKSKPTIKPITDCIITSPNKTLEELLTTGKAKVDVKGVIVEEPRKNQVSLKSWPPGKRFETILNKISKHLESGEIGFTDLSVTETNIVFQVLRERSRDQIYRRFVKDLEKAIEGSISFEIVTVDTNQAVFHESVDQMLLATHKTYTAATEDMLHSEIDKKKALIKEYEILIKIRPIINYGITKKLNQEEVLDRIKQLTDVTKKAATEVINKYRISKLLTIDTDTSDLNNQIKSLKEILKNLPEYVMEDYNGFISG